MAEIVGTVEVRDGCLTLTPDDTTDNQPAALAFDFNDPRPEMLEDGDHFAGTGGYEDMTSVDEMTGFSFPASCTDLDILAVVGLESE